MSCGADVSSTRKSVTKKGIVERSPYGGGGGGGKAGGNKRKDVVRSDDERQILVWEC